MLNHATHALLRRLPTRDVGPTNPSFDISRNDAIARMRAIANDRRRLDRPLLVLGGFLDLGLGPFGVARTLRKVVDGEVIAMQFADCLTFDACRRRVLKRVGPAEVDVIGQSMGGLIALLSAIGESPLRIKRLFTVASPLRGSLMAGLTPLNVWPLQKHMRSDAATYATLAANRPAFPVFSYARLGDLTVGTANASLPGEPVRWLANLWPEPAHVGALSDVRILLDIVLRLRGDAPIATDPPAQLPA